MNVIPLFDWVQVPSEQPKEKDKFERFLARFPEDSAAIEKLERLWRKTYSEPYQGRAIENPVWSNARWNFLKLPIPVKHCNPKGHLGKRVKEGGADPFSWIDSKWEVSKAILRDHSDKSLLIETRSDLIAHDDYLCYLNPKKHRVIFRVITEDCQTRRVLLPGGPSLKRLIKAAEKLIAAGIPVTFVHERIEGLPLEYNRVNLLMLRKLGAEVREERITPTEKRLGLMKRALGI